MGTERRFKPLFDSVNVEKEFWIDFRVVNGVIKFGIRCNIMNMVMRWTINNIKHPSDTAWLLVEQHLKMLKQ